MEFKNTKASAGVVSLLMIGLAIVVFASVNMGCSKDPRGSNSKYTKEVPKNTLPVEKVENFPLASMKNSLFKGPTIFMWKDGIQAADVADVLRALRQMDSNEDIVVQLNDLEYKLTEKPDDAAIKAEIKSLVDADCENIHAWQKKESKEITTCTTDLLRERVSTENGALLEVLVNNVEFFEAGGDPKLFFDLDPSGTKLKLQMKDILFAVGDKTSEVTEYSEVIGNIKDLSYEERGAQINFKVIADWDPAKAEAPAEKHVYEFKIHRTNYNDRAGRKLFKGDIIYQQLDKNGLVVKERRGQIKFSDRSN